jgi:hypothetical protein
VNRTYSLLRTDEQMSNGMLRSEPIMTIDGFIRKYLPLPQPTSATSEPASRFCKYAVTSGQGWCRVWLKCGAIESYTLWTCSVSIAVGAKMLRCCVSSLGDAASQGVMVVPR